MCIKSSQVHLFYQLPSPLRFFFQHRHFSLSLKRPFQRPSVFPTLQAFHVAKGQGCSREAKHQTALPQSAKRTVDAPKIQRKHQLSLVVYTHDLTWINKVLAPLQVVVWDFFLQDYSGKVHHSRCRHVAHPTQPAQMLRLAATAWRRVNRSVAVTMCGPLIWRIRVIPSDDKW